MEDEDQDDSRPRGEISVIAVPLAGKKLTKKLYKVSKKAAASKLLKRGVKEVVKALRKGDNSKGFVRWPWRGWLFCADLGARWSLSSPPSPPPPTPPPSLACSLCIIAGDISPIDVISHLPVLCEERGISFIFVPSKIDLGAAAGTKRPTSCVLIPSGAKPGKGGAEWESGDKLKEAIAEVKELTPSA
jgi:H/ACA ribonucleoprotein complex subunit 2